MIRFCLLLAMTVAVGSAHAEIYKCVGPGGAAAYSDQPCKPDSSSEVLPDHSAVTQQQRDEAQQRVQQMDMKADELENQRAIRDSQLEPPATLPTPPMPVEVIDESSTSGCYDPRRLNSNCVRAPSGRDRGGRVRPR